MDLDAVDLRPTQCVAIEGFSRDERPRLPVRQPVGPEANELRRPVGTSEHDLRRLALKSGPKEMVGEGRPIPRHQRVNARVGRLPVHGNRLRIQRDGLGHEVHRLQLGDAVIEVGRQ